MSKKNFLIFIILGLFIFSSCENILLSNNKSYGNNDISFNLGGPFASAVEKSVMANEQVPNNPDLEVVFELFQGKKILNSKKDNFTLDKLAEASFNLDSVPYGSDYLISVKILYKNIIIYKVLSDPFFLNESNVDINLNLVPVQCNSKINFDLKGGKFPVGTQVPADYFIDSTVVLPTPELPLYNFDGWYLDEECKGERVTQLGKNLFIGDVTLYALWTSKDLIRPVMISPSDSSLIDYGDNITLSCETEGVRIYYTTDGSEPSENSNLYSDSNKIVVDDIILNKDKVNIKAIAFKDRMLPSVVAVKEYSLNRYTISFDKNGHGTAPGDIPAKKNGDTFVLPAALTEPKMHFLYWNVNGKNVNAGESVTVDKNFAENGVVSVIAIWEGVVEPVTFTPAAGEIDYKTTVTLASATKGATIYYTTNGDVPTTSSAIYSKTISIEQGQTIKAIAVHDGMQQAVEKEAAYTIKTYSLEYANSGHGITPNNQSGLKKGDSFTLASALTEDKWHFLGWDLKGSLHNAGEQITVDPSIAEGHKISINAKWEGVVEPVTFSPAAGEIDYKTTVTLSSATSGADIYYTTDGSVPSTSSTQYSKSISIEKGQTIKAIAVKNGMQQSSENSAAYTIKTYTVSFNNNGHGSKTPANISGKKRSDTISAPSALSETGYIFGEWYKESSCTNKWNFATDQIGTSDITLYAKWTPITYTVNFDLNGGSGSVSSMTCTYDRSFTMPNYENTKSGFSSLNAWTVNNDGSGASYNVGATCSTNLCDTDKSSITLYAKWNDDAPGPVTNLKAYRADGGMTVEWTKPNVGDFKHVLVTCGGQSKEINGTSASFTGLDNATAYTITAKVYDKGNNVSTEQSVSKNKMVSLTGYQTPQISGKKVTFGVWPQTEKVPSVNFDGTNTAKINGWNCRFGDDGQYYVEVKKLSDSYYFKVEPIVWKVISEGSGKKLIVSEKVITASKFGEGSCTYKDSTLRNYLNNEFKTKAFSTSGESRIANTNLGNGVTADKIFPLCKSDYTTGSYGFSSDADRIAYMTPYSYEIGVTNMNSQAQFWTRTEENTPNASTNSYYVDVKGRLQLSVNTSVEGVQPAMWITN